VHHTLCDYLAEAVQNGFEAGATLVAVEWVEDAEWIRVTVGDNGRGMDEAARKRALDPFCSDGAKHPGRRVGLGLPLLAQTAQAAGGTFELKSEPGTGTTIELTFRAAHVDTPPAGDVAGAVAQWMNLAGAGRTLLFHRRTPRGGYRTDSAELGEAAGGLETAAGFLLARGYLAAQEAALRGDD